MLNDQSYYNVETQFGRRHNQLCAQQVLEQIRKDPKFGLTWTGLSDRRATKAYKQRAVELDEQWLESLVALVQLI